MLKSDKNIYCTLCFISLHLGARCSGVLHAFINHARYHSNCKIRTPETIRDSGICAGFWGYPSGPLETLLGPGADHTSRGVLLAPVE